MIETEVSLSPQQAVLYDFLVKTGVDIDVPIITLHFKLDVRPRVRVRFQRKRYSPREMQQQVGSAASRVNKKIKVLGHVIVPGALKHTYRLTKTAKR